MVNRNLIRSLDDDEIINELAVLAPEEEADEWLLEWLEQEQQDYAQGEIVDGRIVEVNDEWALIDALASRVRHGQPQRMGPGRGKACRWNNGKSPH